MFPAVSGQFVSHGLRTFAFEGSLTGLKALTGGAAELQMQALASGVGTMLGTVVRIPCEVLKQRLQVRAYPLQGHLAIVLQGNQGHSAELRGPKHETA